MINRLSIRNKKIIIILILIATIIPLAVFLTATMVKPNDDVIVMPTKSPLPTFPDSQRVENELVIQYAQGYEFEKLTSSRQQEIDSIYKGLGVISYEKAYPEITNGELSRSYVLKFKDGIDLENAAQRIYELPEIEGAQPNTEFGLF